MRNLRTFLFFILTLGIVSCSKDESGSTSSDCKDYLPYRVGTKLTVKPDNFPSEEFEIKEAKSSGGLTYYKGPDIVPNFKIYFAKNAEGSVFIETQIDTMGIQIPIKFKSLDITKKQGESWTDEVSLIVINININTKILSISNSDIVIDGKTYNKMIKTESVIDAPQGKITLNFDYVCGFGLYKTYNDGKLFAEVTKYTF